MDNSSWWPPATKSRHRSCQRRMCGRWVTCASRSWEAPATGSRHRSCQRKMCGQLLLPLRTQQQQTAWSCDKEDACGQRLLVAASSKEQTQKLPKEDVWTAAAASAHQAARKGLELRQGGCVWTTAARGRQQQRADTEAGKGGCVDTGSPAQAPEHPLSRRHLGLAHNCRQGPWGTLPLATTGKPRTAPRKPYCRERFSADLSMDWTLAPSSPERVLLTARVSDRALHKQTTKAFHPTNSNLSLSFSSLVSCCSAQLAGCLPCKAQWILKLEVKTVALCFHLLPFAEKS